MAIDADEQKIMGMTNASLGPTHAALRRPKLSLALHPKAGKDGSGRSDQQRKPGYHLSASFEGLASHREAAATRRGNQGEHVKSFRERCPLSEEPIAGHWPLDGIRSGVLNASAESLYHVLPERECA